MLSLERDMFPRWLEGDKRLFGYAAKGRFIDIGVPEDYAAAGALFGGQGETEGTGRQA